jgi:glycosyltransferase involved in cell wall biosynthesis
LHRFVTTVRDRREAGIPDDRVVEIRAPAYLARALQRLPSPRAQIASYYLGDAWFDRAASRFAREADIYHVFSNHGLQGLRAAKRAGGATVVERASAHPHAQDALLQAEFARLGLPYPALTRRVAARAIQEFAEADWIVACSDFVRQTLLRAGVPAAKVRTIPLGFDPERFSPAVTPADTFRVLFVGPLSAQKGLPHLLEGFRRAGLPRDRSELLLVGEPWPEARAFLPRYEGVFRRVPFVPQAELASIYRTGAVLVLPSIQDGFGMVVYEAAACGLPVIVSENVGAPIVDGAHGFVVPIRDADAIAAKLVYLFAHEDVRRRMGEAARAHVARFTWARYQDEVARLHDEIRETQRARRSGVERSPGGR